MSFLSRAPKKILNIIKSFFSSIRENKILTLILIVAAILRFMGTYPGYNQYHADEGITYSAAASMIKNGNLDPLRYDYPALVPEINYLFFKFFFIPLRWVQFYLTNSLKIIDGYINFPLPPLEARTIFQTYVLGERNLNALFWGRLVTALFSLGNVLLVFILASKLFNKKVGLIAAFLLAFNFKHVINSHIGLPDIYNAFFVLLTLICCVNLWRKPSFKSYLLAGLAVALSFSVKFQVFAAFPYALVHLYLVFKNYKQFLKKPLSTVKPLFNPGFIISTLLTPVLFAILNPYFLLNFEKAVKIVQGVSMKYGMGIKQLNIYPFSYFYHIDYGPLEFFVIWIGLLIALKKYKLQSLLLLAPVLPFMFVMVYYSNGGFYIRNFITVTPIFLIFAAVAIWFLFELLIKKTNKKIGLFLILTFLTGCVFIPGRNALINSYSYTKPWGYDNLRPWVEQNLPKDVVVAIHPFDAVNLKIKNKRTEYEVSGAYSIAEHKENGAKYAVMNLNFAGNTFYFWMSYGLKDLKLFWDKPLGIMRNTYPGISAEELFRYQVQFVSKPWQAPDAHLVVAKLPEWPEVNMRTLSTFNFDKEINGWAIFGKFGNIGKSFEYDPKVGHLEKGSIAFLPGGARFPSERITSKPFSIKPGHLYKIEGYLKTEKKLTTREREGFIRADFYGENPDLDNIGLITSVSSRVYGSDDWVKKQILDRAPEKAKYMTVSFQAQNLTVTRMWLDDVSVLESNDPIKDITASAPYVKNEVDLNYVYPNSHGNL